ncbi:MAG TPA: VTT domain-containing protein [Aeromicrobium sp.]|nr:VTT domain-containing protein [Aeromicrobium sp.]
MVTLIPDWLDAEHILTSFGPAAIWVAVAIVFVECGLLFPILPGDSLLFVAGILVAQDVATMPNIVTACLLLTIAAVAGNATGYAIGAKVGPALFDRPDSRIFKPEYLDKTHEFFEKYGAPAIILARFVPIVRTFITAVAGAGRMGFARFMALSAIGGVIWATGLTLMGYWLGNVDFIRNNVEAIAIVIVLISVVPFFVEGLRRRQRS